MKEPLVEILHVEDDADIRKITELTLATVGQFKITSCESGVEALEKAKTLRPQLVLLDVMMPVMSGIDVFKELKKLEGYQQVPVVFMTAKVQATEVERYMELGVCGVIPKPFDPMALPDQLNTLWNAQ
ncbi:response regulator [Endozoicomonas atrinae]|uniref:response regulator n=1 Tax=Endozoicomonas atrinae TaxID=1333660 RepID=UPI0008262FD4|nr:response regulator [Endozoicomonas atrinae]